MSCGCYNNISEIEKKNDQRIKNNRQNQKKGRAVKRMMLVVSKQWKKPICRKGDNHLKKCFPLISPGEWRVKNCERISKIYHLTSSENKVKYIE